MMTPDIYVSLLALAETADSTEEYLKQMAAADRAAQEEPSLRDIPNLWDRVAHKAEQYRQEGI